MPEKLAQLLRMGFLAQISVGSLLGGFGRWVARFTPQLSKKDYVQLMASDAHSTRSRPPMLAGAAKKIGQTGGQGAGLGYGLHGP